VDAERDPHVEERALRGTLALGKLAVRQAVDEARQRARERTRALAVEHLVEEVTGLVVRETHGLLGILAVLELDNACVLRVSRLSQAGLTAMHGVVRMRLMRKSHLTVVALLTLFSYRVSAHLHAQQPAPPAGQARPPAPAGPSRADQAKLTEVWEPVPK